MAFLTRIKTRIFCQQYRFFIGAVFLVLIAGTLGSFLLKGQPGLTAKYFSGVNWDGTLLMKRSEPSPNVGANVGDMLVNSHEFSVKWQAWIAIREAGTYTFATTSDDGSYVRIDGHLVVDNGGVHGSIKKSGTVDLSEGSHRIEVLFFQGGGSSMMQTFWTPPEQPETPVPPDVFFVKRPLSINASLLQGAAFMFTTLSMLWCVILIGGSAVLLFIVRRNTVVWLGLLCLLCFSVAYFSPVEYVRSDPFGTLLTSQAILQHGTIKLDAYQETEQLQGYTWQLDRKNGHVYYHYPLGTPLYALPFVWGANRLGLDMADGQDDALLQNILSALSSGGALLLIYALSRQFVSRGWSVLFSIAFLFGSPLMSTMGTGLWNMNLTTLFILGSLLLVLKKPSAHIGRGEPYLLALCLFSAYLCRPSAVLFIAWILFYVLLSRYAFFWRVSVLLLVLGAGFLLFSFLEYQQVLPDYYLPTQLGPPGTFWTAIYGHLASPSRGVFVFSPYLLIPGLGLPWTIKSRRKDLLLWGTLGWLGLHLLLIARNHAWGGGGCFGSRMFTEAFPGLLLLTLLVWKESILPLPTVWRRIVTAGFVILTAGSLFINSCQGMFNRYTIDWNAFPVWEIGGNAYLFDWRYPQFLANPDNLVQRYVDYTVHALPPYTIGENFVESESTFFHFIEAVSTDEGQRVFQTGHSWAGISFTLENSEIAAHDDMALEVSLTGSSEKPVKVVLNDHELGVMQCQPHGRSVFRFPLDSSHLIERQRQKPGFHNQIIFLSTTPEQLSNPLDIELWQVRLCPEYRADMQSPPHNE